MDQPVFAIRAMITGTENDSELTPSPNRLDRSGEPRILHWATLRQFTVLFQLNKKHFDDLRQNLASIL